MKLTWMHFGGDDPSPRLTGQADREDRLAVIGLAQERAKQPFCCEDCAYCSTGSISYEYGDYDPPSCCARPFIANLKTFPFKCVPEKCHAQSHFSLDFWRSEFATLYYVADDAEDRMTLRLWRISDAYGRVKLNARNQARVDEALSRFMAKKKDAEEL